MTTSTIISESTTTVFGNETTYMFNLYATTTENLINDYYAIVDECIIDGEVVEVNVWFTSDCGQSLPKDKTFNNAEDAHLYAMKQLMRIKKSIC